MMCKCGFEILDSRFKFCPICGVRVRDDTPITGVYFGKPEYDSHVKYEGKGAYLAFVDEPEKDRVLVVLCNKYGERYVDGILMSFEKSTGKYRRWVAITTDFGLELDSCFALHSY